MSLDTGFTDSGNNSTALHSRRAYDLLSEGFGPGFNGPLMIVADGSLEEDPQLGGLVTALTGTPGVAAVGEPVFNDSGSTAGIIVYPDSAPQDSATSRLVHTLRGDVIPAATQGTGVSAYVAGSTAAEIDVGERITSRTPIFFAVVIGLSFLLLMVVFRSVLIPIKAAVLNLLSIGAAYGVVVAIFQWGWLAGPLGINSTGPIEPFLPMMMFAILFGLSMDYEVFLVSRIREEHVMGLETKRAIASGVSSTARVITSAALIMIVVFGSFVLGDERVIKEFGLGLAVAVLIDATIVRLVLVPSIMQLIGDANWWMPSWLGRALPNFQLDGRRLAGRPLPTGAEGG
ncbi:MAG: MMPL family transporter [Dehalococcoidia bacterium]